MIVRRLVVVADAASAPSEDPGTTVLVLDPTWTPMPDARPDLLAARSVMGPVMERADLFDDALAIVDAWADASRIADSLLVEDTTYWFRLREGMWRWVHERLLWRRTLAQLEADGRLTEILLDTDEPALADVIRALGHPAPASSGSAPAATPVAEGRRQPSIVGRFRRLIGRGAKPSTPADDPRVAREATLRDRVERLATTDRPRVVILTNPGTHQRIGSGDATRQDPLFGRVIPDLEARGFQPILLATGLDQRRDDDWSMVAADERMLPQVQLRTRWSRPTDEERATAALGSVAAAIDAAADTTLELDGLSMTPAFLDALQTAAKGIVRIDVHMLARIERFLDELRPAAIVLAQEGIRTPWLMAGARAGIPVVAVQHGILYPGHAGYPPRRHPALRLATRTCVNGSYERDVLLGLAYRPEEVVVTGSPRLDLDADAAMSGDRAEDRAAVRRELGVAPEDRLLMISTVNVRIVQAHLVHTLEALLSPPPGGIHLVFKQHPGEHDEGPYRSLVEGLALAAGVAPPPITVVKDIDLYRLLRAADAHLGLFSTVLTEAVVTRTPNLIAMTDGHADLLGYVDAGVGDPVRTPADVAAVMVAPGPPDQATRARFLARFFQAGDASPRICDVIEAVITARPAEVAG